MTAADLTRAGWVLDLSEGDLQREVGVLSVARAKVYAADGRIHTLVAARDGRHLLATVSGSERTRYQTVVELIDEDGPEWSGRCTCPVRIQCKHAVATIICAQLRLREQGRTGPPDWESLLTPLVRGADRGPSASLQAPWRLGLQVGLQGGLGGVEESMRVTLVPVREGTGRPWVRQGVSWRDLVSSYRVHEVDPAQRAALVPLHTISQGPVRFQGAVPELVLGDLGRLAWPALAGVVRAGVTLVPGPGLTLVELGDGTVELGLDLTRRDEGLRVGVSVQRAGEGDTGEGDTAGVDGGRLFVVGRPGHGLARVSEAGELTLWPLTSEPEPLLAQLLERGEPVLVPEPDVQRFLAHYYPSLARRVRVTSRDGTVDTAEAPGPVLRLTLTPEPEHRLRLRWTIAYPVPGGDEVVEVGLEHRQDDPPRDLGAEARAVAAVGPLLAACPELVEHPPRGVPRPVTERALQGRSTIVFATQVLPMLEAAEEVEVVLEGELPTYEEAEEAPVVVLDTSEGAADDWFDLHVSVTVAGQTVPFEPLFAALARGDDMMLLESGTFFSLDVPELHTLRRLIEEARELEDRPPREATVGLTRWQAGLWEELTDIGVVRRQSQAWRESVDALLALGEGGGDLARAKVPDRLQAELRPYQLEGFEWLARLWDHRLGGVLADDMGLGKTLQMLAVLARAEERGDLAEGPVLIVAPASVVPVWASEAARFAPHLRVATIAASAARRGTDLATEVGGADLVVTSYTLLRLGEQEFRQLPWSALVLDEAQAVKNPRSKTHRAVRGVGGVRTFVLTGTPLENSLKDLWAMFALAAPGLFGSAERFTRGYVRPVESGDPADRDEVLGRLRRRIRPFLLRRTKREVAADLPRKTEQVLSVPLAVQHRRVYDRHLQRERQRVLGLLADMDKNRVAIFRALTILRQLALDPGLVDPEHAGIATSSKVTLLLEHLVELAAEGHRALVFSSFTSYLALVREALEARGIPYSYLDGRTRDRSARVEGFRNGDDPVFLISLKAGGVGLTLTEADYVYVLDPWWNPAAEAQAVDRTHRIGQTRPVNVYRLVSSDTIEEKVVALQARKRELFTTVVDAGEFRSGRVSAADIRGLLDD
ncbi:DEAD/DEAH box helicase [Ornithinimicrobium flavum]|uniref:DEAD/DEAH box helicase n=1 Tax=Ornithinimicrobium flavum TaxID=1288636 RepID=UPI0010703F14|nr:DEAD/DEAH box helicase [Ornithinimicrobium flavum]